jgi:TrmH family RNA methyltransferase
MIEPLRIRSRGNALLKAWRRLAHDNTGYRDARAIWIEGEHLCQAALLRGLAPSHVVYSNDYWESIPRRIGPVASATTVVLPDRLFAELSALDSPAGVGFVLPLGAAGAILPLAPTVVLDRVQDAGNVGSILRSAAAFGFTQVLALQGSAALWGPKVLRAGMGAHFGLHLVEMLGAEELEALRLPLLATHPHAGEPITGCVLPWPCAWVFGHEGQGVAASLVARAQISVRIEQPGTGESLNVAACAAICLHASSLQGKPATG